MRSNFLRCIGLLCLTMPNGFVAAADAGSGERTSTTTDPTETVAVSTGIAFTSPYSVYGNLGILFAPATGLDQSGFRWRVGTVDGQFSYPAQDPSSRLYGLGLGASFLVGYSFNQGSTSFLVMLGPNVQNIGLSSPDPPNPTQSTAFGPQVLTELYSNPTKNSKIDFEAEYSTAFNSYFVRFDPGYDVLGNGIFVGPKLVFLGDTLFQQWWTGASISGFKIGRVDLSFSAGYVRDRERGGGTFAGLDLYFRY